MSGENALTHNEANVLLGDYIAKELSEHVQLEVTQHLNTCKFCQADYAEIRRIRRIIGTLNVPLETNASSSLADSVLTRLDKAPMYASEDLNTVLDNSVDELSEVQEIRENHRPLFPVPGVLNAEIVENKHERNTSKKQQKNQMPLHNRNERTTRMKAQPYPMKQTKINTLWLTLVAVLILAIIFGSLFAFRAMLFGDHNNGPTRPGHSITTPKPKSTPTPTPTTVPSPTPTAVVILPTQTDCPPDGTARAAVMPAITLGNHPNIFYTANTNNAFDLNRYDVITDQTTRVASISLDQLNASHGSLNPAARLSNDGQWIIFHGIVGSQDAIQMVRVDGQELQTLYCGKVDSMLLSPDQKTLAFNVPFSDLEMLDMVTGKLQTDYTDSAKLGIYYQPFKWYTNTSLYIMRQAIGVGGTGPFTLRYNFGIDLVKDITLDSASQATNLQNMFPQRLPNQGFSICADFDANQDQILTSDCTTTAGMKGPSTIKIQTLDGNASTIYTDPNNVIMYARFASPTKILFITQNQTLAPGTTYVTSQNVASWEVNTDGTGLTQITSLADNNGFSMDQTAHTSWYIVSRDSSQYAVYIGSSTDKSPGSNGLFFGALQANSAMKHIPGTFVTGEGEFIALVGWSTF